MNCPLCQSELTINPSSIYPDHTDRSDIHCEAGKLELSYYHSHYSKGVSADWSYFTRLENMIVYPYLIINHDVVYSDKIVGHERIPGKKSVYVSIKKYNPNRMTTGCIKELRPGFERILTFPGYLHPDTDTNLRERLKLLLLFS